MKNQPLPRLDQEPELRDSLLKYCRLQPGEIWVDQTSGHKVGCLDATNTLQIAELMTRQTSNLAIHDPPYNLIAFDEQPNHSFVDWCRMWIENSWECMAENSALYVWLGADQRNHFQPLPEFMIMMRDTQFTSKSLITMRNQRGYGTQKNWMAVRQELLYYVKGNPAFTVQYTDIPRILRGYYKKVNGEITENLSRSKSNNIRPGNVWVDIQQVFYRMEENVSGCYAQKPLKSIERLVHASSNPDDLVIDFFAHSGTTLLACELHGRRCYTTDVDPIYCEITIRRLERYRNSGKLGWQNSNPFADEVSLPQITHADFTNETDEQHEVPSIQPKLL